MSASSLAEPVAATATPSAEAPAAWPLPLRIAFRFAFVFLSLLYFPFPLDYIPGVGMLWSRVWHPLVVAFGAHVLGVSVAPSMTGSGDKLFDWVQLALALTLSAVVTLVWSIAARRARSHPRAYVALRTYIRFGLAAAMIGYGAVKIFPSQFPPPNLDRLMQPVGDLSPMGLLWLFMGSSVAYNVFTGVGEVLAGILLTMRRTALLGALLSAAIMLHVLVLNLAYDVPVKIYSAMLLLTALVIVAPDAKRLAAFFLQAPEKRGWTIPAVRTFLVAALVVFSLYDASRMRQQRVATFGDTPLTGVWEIESLTLDGVSRPPLTTDLTRWRRLIISGSESGTLQRMNDARTRVELALDEAKRTLSIKSRFDDSVRMTLQYQQPDARTLVVSGTENGAPVQATLRRGEERKFLLRERGFHWVSERPFNR